MDARQSGPAADAARNAFQGASPWNATLPVAAGVFLGALLFGLFALAYLHAQVRQPASFDGVSSTSSTASQAEAVAAARDGGTANPEAALPRMPGLIEANRRRLARACIAGTVGHRRSNGWVQAVEDDQPRRCIATTQ